MSYQDFCDYMRENDLIDEFDREKANELYKLYLGNMKPSDFVKFQRQWIKDNQPKELKYQMFTFTTDPSKQDLQAQEEYIKSILKRKENLQLFLLSYCIEHIDSNAHFHVVLGSYKSIPADAFKQYSKNFGIVYKSKKVSRNVDGLADYITKETVKKTLLNTLNVTL